MFMYHPDTTNIGDARRYWKGWRGRYVPSSTELAQLVTKYVVSPCMWGGGVRKRENFRYAEWFGLDFDENVTLEDAKKTFEPYMHVIGTTKSHQVEKNGKVCDRFRVFLKFGDRCHGRDDYEETAKFLIAEYGADAACKDAARLFWPCKTIEVCKYHGKVLQVVKYDEARKKQREEALAARAAKIEKSYKPTQGIPPWARLQLDHGAAPGQSKTVCCYRVARDLNRTGYSESEAFSIISSSAIPKDSSSRCLRDVRKAVQSAYSKPL